MTKLIIGLVVGLAIGDLVAFFAIRKVTVKKNGDFINSLTLSKETIRQFFMRYLSEKELENYVRDLKDKLSSKIYALISDPSVSSDVSHVVVGHLVNKLSTDDEEKDTSKRSFRESAMETLKNMLKSRAEEILVKNQEVIEQLLGEKINKAVLNDGNEIISSIIGNEIDKLLEQPVSTLMDGNEEMITTIKQRVKL